MDSSVVMDFSEEKRITNQTLWQSVGVMRYQKLQMVD